MGQTPVNTVNRQQWGIGRKIGRGRKIGHRCPPWVGDMVGGSIYGCSDASLV